MAGNVPQGSSVEKPGSGGGRVAVHLLFFSPALVFLIRILWVHKGEIAGAGSLNLFEGILSLILSSFLLGKFVYLFLREPGSLIRSNLISNLSGMIALILSISILRISGITFISPITGILPFLLPFAIGEKMLRDYIMPVAGIAIPGSLTLVTAILIAGDSDLSRLFQLGSGGVFLAALVVVSRNGEIPARQSWFIFSVALTPFLELISGFPMEWLAAFELFIFLYVFPEIQPEATDSSGGETTPQELKEIAHSLQSYQSMLSDVILEQNYLEKNRYETYEILKRGIERISHIFDDSHTSLENGEVGFQPEPFQLEPVMRTEMRVIVPYLENKKVGLIIEVSEHLPPVIGDENLIRDVLHSLLHNAAKFTDYGVISLSAIIEDDQHVCIQVTDTGCGISEKVVKNLILPGSGGSSPYVGKSEGAGLGLLKVKKILRMHGTTLDLNSSPGEGSSFLFVLPLAASPDRSINQSQTRFQVIRPGFNEQDSEKDLMPAPAEDQTEEKPVILAIDDESINLNVYENSLRSFGYDVLTAETGMDGIEIIQTRRVDLVLLDVMMPVMDGYEVCKRIRMIHDKVSLPVLIVTARGSTADLSAAFEAGASDFIVKPIDRAVLLSRIQNSLGIKRSHTLKLELEKNKEKTKGLMELNISKDFFLSLISHDLKGGIGSIVYMVEKLQKNRSGEIPENILRSLDLIHRTGKKNLNLLSDLLEWSRSQMGLMKFNPEEFSIPVEIGDILVSLRDRLEEKSITIINEISDFSHLTADRKMFEAIVRNILNNAIKFSLPEGTIRISDRNDDEGITLSISDSGKGIPEKVLRQINGKETVNPSRGTAGETGNGMGLILVREFIKRHNGSFRVESREGDGTTILLFFPKFKTLKASLR